ncbi:MAG: hypothetical protein HOP33_20400 [Verrucomicrobia bacterium]|nr:hypothetical protein [Verrucomicrobiota bacterium]
MTTTTFFPRYMGTACLDASALRRFFAEWIGNSPRHKSMARAMSVTPNAQIQAATQQLSQISVGHPMNNEYPDKDYPYNFYFNGELMPKWGASWSLADIWGFLDTQGDEFHRDVWVLYCRIDHVGVVESADADLFVCAIQEVLHILLSQREKVFTKLAEQSYGDPNEIYTGLIDAAFRMRELTISCKHALWTSGYECDQPRLVEIIRRCHLPKDSPEFILFPHLRQLQSRLEVQRKCQITELHQLAQSGKLDKSLRKKLYEMR